MHRHVRLSAVTTVTALVLAVPIAASAETSPSIDDLVTDVVSLSKSDIESAAQDRDSARERARAAQSFRQDQARSGRLLDADETEALVVEGFTAVWAEDVVVESIDVATTTIEGDDSGGAAQEVAIEAALDGGAAASLNQSGLAMREGSGARGGSLKNAACITWITKKRAADSGNSVVQCFEKYKITSSTADYDRWFYSRWALARGGTSHRPFHYKPVYVDLRSRPHHNFPGRVLPSGLLNFWPKDSSKFCTSTGTVGYSYSGFSLSIPVASCDGLNPLPNSYNSTMGVTWSDALPYTGAISKGVDFGMAVKVRKGMTPYFGDYAYVKFCNDVLICGTSNPNLKTQGW